MQRNGSSFLPPVDPPRVLPFLLQIGVDIIIINISENRENGLPDELQLEAIDKKPISCNNCFISHMSSWLSYCWFIPIVLADRTITTSTSGPLLASLTNKNCYDWPSFLILGVFSILILTGSTMLLLSPYWCDDDMYLFFTCCLFYL